MRLIATLLALALAAPAAAAPYLPGVVSSPSSEVRLAVSPNGSLMAWGLIGPNSDLDIVVSRRGADGHWSAAERASFDAEGNDFDPSFSPDRRTLVFFSNRAGGAGGTDLYAVTVGADGGFSPARSLGATVNTARNEWAPTFSPDGRRLVFSSAGRGGEGGHDLFVSTRTRRGWSRPVPLSGGVNSPADDFDAVFIDARTVVFSRGDAENGPLTLYLARLDRPASAPVRLPSGVNCSDFVIGPSVSATAPRTFFWSAACPGGAGRMDIQAMPLSALPTG